jgi:predicted nucleic acid-binding protein
MDRLLLDANVLFSAAYRANAGLLRFWELNGITLCTSRYAVEEARTNLTEKRQRERLEELTGKLELAEVHSARWPSGIVLPDKDRPILLAAIESCATHLITGDLRHFGRYFGKTIRGVLVVTPSGYLKSREVRNVSR